MPKSKTYEEFIEKFKPKLTTDDCATPERVYDAVLGWVVKEYGIDPKRVLRPFWPGMDYQQQEYPEGCVVVDNPPFSILSKICEWYLNRNIKFFLFAPSLTARHKQAAEAAAERAAAHVWELSQREMEIIKTLRT